MPAPRARAPSRRWRRSRRRARPGRARSRRCPVLSETESSARRIAHLARLGHGGADAYRDEDAARMPDRADRAAAIAAPPRTAARARAGAAPHGPRSTSPASGQVDGALGDDRPGVHALVDEVDGDAEDLDAVVERLLDRVEAREGGQQRRVHVDHAVREARPGSRARQLHVAGEHDELDPARGEPGRHRSVARRPVGEVLARERRGRRCPRSRARSSACASGLSEPTATTSTPSRPWTRSRIACRFVPSPEARTPTRSREPSFGKRPPVERSVPASSSASTRASTSAPVRCAEGAVLRQPVVGVLLDHLRAPAAQDLHRARAADGRLGRLHDGEDGVVERVARRRPAAARPAAARRGAAPRAAAASAGRERRVADVAAGDARVRRGRRRVAEVRAGRPRGGRCCPRPRPRRCGTGASGPSSPPGPTSRRATRARPSHSPVTRPSARSGGDGAGCMTPARARWPRIGAHRVAGSPLAGDRSSSRNGMS